MSSSSEQSKLDMRATLPDLDLSVQELEQMPDDAFWEYARQRAHAIPETLSSAEYLECRLSSKTCLVALHSLAEVLQPPHRLALLPGMPAWMIGIMAWRGETIAVVDLDCYLSDKPGISSLSATNAMLLVAKQQNHTFGLLIPAIGFTSTIELEQVTPLSALTNFTFAEKNEVIEGAFSDIPILSIPALLTMLVQQIGMTTYHG